MDVNGGTCIEVTLLVSTTLIRVKSYKYYFFSICWNGTALPSSVDDLHRNDRAHVHKQVLPWTGLVD